MGQQHRLLRAAVVPVWLVFVFFGCAKAPATTLATAPGPVGPAGSGAGSDGDSGGALAKGVSGDLGAAQGSGRGAGGRGGVQGAGDSIGGAGSEAAAKGGRNGFTGDAVRTGGAGAGGGQGGSRPEPREFAAIAALRDIHFDFDRYDIGPENVRTLTGHADWLRGHPRDLLLIEGHCDDRGTNDYNLALGQHRADATMRFLVSQGVQAGRITVITYGEEQPLCTDQKDECWAKNRRAHFLVKQR